MQEQHSGALGLGHIQLVFLELPKLDVAREPRTAVEKWAYFFREAKNLETIPPSLAEPPLRSALEAARMATFTGEEWDAYIRAQIAIQDGRGALSLARREGLKKGREEGRREGREEGREEALRQGIESLCEVLGIELNSARLEELDRLSTAELDALLTRLRKTRAWS
jgi:flagellar biosynthesis/type III secretory pathway protein FliH